MPFINTDKIPQNSEPIKTTDIKQLVAILPETIPYKINVSIGGNMGRHGITTGNLVFLVEILGEPTSEMQNYFNELVAPLGINAACYDWRSEKGQRIYNSGTLNIDRETLAFKFWPTPAIIAPVLTIEEFMSKIPSTVPFDCEIDLTGGLLKNGWSAHDGDLIVEDVNISNQTRKEIAKYFTNLIGWKFDCGQKCMDERGSVYKTPLYKKGKLWQQQA